MKVLIALAACGLTVAQTPNPSEPQTSDLIIRTPVTIVVAPTTVLDKNGNYINGLTPQDFILHDNGRVQRIAQDVAFQPMSMVVAVQASSNISEILPKVQKIGIMLDNLVAGQDGETAVIAFDHRIRTIQEFTSDAGKIEAALKKITPGSSSSRMIDATVEAVRLLKARPDNRRRILLIISEKRDKSSEGRLREALAAAQFANVSIYSIDISHLMAQLSAKPDVPRPDPIPATATHVPAGAVQTPTSIALERNNGNFIPLFVDIFKGAKSFFVDDALDVLTRYTGGKEYPFLSQHSLERAVTAVGEELHSQYLLSYHPDNLAEGGFHEIKVTVNRPNLEIRTRPGYWIGGGQ